jgi:MoxR-like ATPase
MIGIKNIEDALRATGYYPRPGDVLFLKVLLQPGSGRIRAGLISGPPGVGKTSLGRALARALRGEEIYFLCHHWVTEEDLFLRVDPARVAALAGGLAEGRPEDAWRPGVLLRAALASQRGPVVLIIDEIDKAPERVDALLLDFLQTGQVVGPFGERWAAHPENLVVILTDNGLRPLAEPLLRRVFRYRMGFLPPEVEADLIRKQTGAPAPLARAVVALMSKIRAEGGSSPSLQEGVGLAAAMAVAGSAADVALLIRGFLLKTPEDEEALGGEEGIRQAAAALWGEWRRPRKGGAP